MSRSARGMHKFEMVARDRAPHVDRQWELEYYRHLLWKLSSGLFACRAD